MYGCVQCGKSVQDSLRVVYQFEAVYPQHLDK